MNIGSWNSDSIGMLFSSVGNRNANANADNLSSLTSLLSDYNSIKTGAYGKVVKAYYAKGENSDTTSSKKDKVNSSTSTAEDSTKTLNAIQTATDVLSETTEALRDKAKTADSMDDLYDTVSSFVKDYNAVVNTATVSNTDTIQSSLADLTFATSTNSKLLSKVGITVNEDNTLKLDADKFKAGSLSTAQTLFKGVGSYAYGVALNTAMMNGNADYQASKANTYEANGSYSNNYTTGDLFDSLF